MVTTKDITNSDPPTDEDIIGRDVDVGSDGECWEVMLVVIEVAVVVVVVVGREGLI